MKNKSLIGREQGKPFIAKDGALIYELFKNTSVKSKNISIATGLLKPGQIALPHFHTKTEEIYYILSGEAKVTIDEKTYRIKIGEAIFVPVRAVHALKNTSKTKPLKVMAISSPPYSDKDIFFI